MQQSETANILFIMAKKIISRESEERSVFYNRLTAIADAVGVSHRQFGVKIGKSLGYIGSVGDDISTSVVINILAAFPTVNLHYILYGEGEILLSEARETIENQKKDLSLNNYFEKKIIQQEKEIRELHQEIGRLHAIIEGKKQCVQPEDNAAAAVAG